MTRDQFIKKVGIPAMGVVLGAAAGYVYWYYWGCEEGCTIRSVWWRMSIWGGLMGGLLFSLLQDAIAKRQKKP